MIQRIQSIWLLLACVTISCLIFVPIVNTSIGSAQYLLTAQGIYEKVGEQSKQLEASLPVLISTIAIALLALFNIFNFRKRALQKRIALVTIVLIIGLSFWCSQYAKKIPGGLENANYNVGLFLPVISIFFILLAIRGINNDEKLIKSADRLR
ncbi:DUF4293 domain-containing protein [Pedobacter sp. KR3-3]|uniref:DUF4293 domain-containing protein n=1 Tax=Pedobacter albus TaxID=3113905 RepID=A0ABU7I850_9SPHI|nr:DUF4293 domain-containing protein [Pedobacter sp. KR3-3]MEE1945645.1 DUF4293 domain-containing protein [Pedobacter sp. KR3-3]